MKRSLLVFTLLFSPVFTITSCGCNKNEPSKEYCSVTFHAGNGYFNESKGQEKTKIVQVEKGKNVDRPLDPLIEDDDYEFDNWYIEEDGNTKFDFTNAITEDVDAYAKYNFVGEEPFYFEIASGEEVGKGIASISFSTYDSETNPIHFEEIQYYIGTDYEFAEWTYYNGEGEEITFPEGKKLYIKSLQTSWNNVKITYTPPTNTELGFNIGGNIMSLLNPDDFKNMTAFQSQDTFNGLFCSDPWLEPLDQRQNGVYLKDASSLKLPAATLSVGCYQDMFRYSSLVYGPKAIAGGAQIDYPDRSCREMFHNCTSLLTLDYGFVNASNIGAYAFYDAFSYCHILKNIDGFQIGSPDGQIDEYGCAEMFMSDNSVTNKLDLEKLIPIKTMADFCYYRMFLWCRSINTIIGRLPATTLAPYCYAAMFGNLAIYEIKDIAEIIPETNLAEGCYSQMFEKCYLRSVGGQLPATTLAPNCYSYMFGECNGLETIDPYLLSKPVGLASGCYGGMFTYCSSLKKSPILPYQFNEADKEIYKDYDSCYHYMFHKCDSLEEIEVGFSEFPHNSTGQEDGYSYTLWWLNDVNGDIERTFKWRGGTDLTLIPHRDDSTNTLPSSLNWKLVHID